LKYSYLLNANRKNDSQLARVKVYNSELRTKENSGEMIMINVQTNHKKALCGGMVHSSRSAA